MTRRALAPVGAHQSRGTIASAVVAAAVACLMLLSGLPAAAEVPHVLVYSGTYGFRHSSIAYGNAVIQELADATGAFTVEFTELTTDLSRSSLRDVDILLFNSTTGRFPLTRAEREGLERYWGCGGGFVGVHAAADANYGWAAYAELVGAQFDSHPHDADAGDVRLLVENQEHPVNTVYAGMSEWLHDDEYYRWMRDVRGTQDVVPLLVLDESTVAAGIQDGNTPYVHHQPVSWTKSFRGQGRVHYTNLGHREATWDRTEFRQSLVDGIGWASDVELDLACFDGDGPLPPGPQPPPVDAEAPREPCVLGPDEERLTPDGLSHTLTRPGTPAYSSKALHTYVLDLSDHGSATGDVNIRLSWPSITDDYDLAVSTPWGFAGSDAMQPLYEPFESTRVDDVPHCAPIQVAAFNHAAVAQEAPVVTLAVDAPVEEGPQSRGRAVPGTPAVVMAPPSGTAVGFAPPAAVITEGGSLTLVNGDTVTHNLVCQDVDPATYRPLCLSGHATTLGGTSPVEGVEELPPGSYDFLCQLHPQMVGTLTVVGVG